MTHRVRLRTVLLGIVLIALVLGGLSAAYGERRRAYFQSRVENFAWGEADVVEQIARELKQARELETRGPDGIRQAVAARARAEKLAELAAWHVKLERIYAWAAEHPTAKVPPLPPPPN